MNDNLNRLDKTINRFIEEIRKFSQLSNDEMRMVLKRIAAEKPDLFEIFELEAERKTLKDIKKMIREIKNLNP